MILAPLFQQTFPFTITPNSLGLRRQLPACSGCLCSRPTISGDTGSFHGIYPSLAQGITAFFSRKLPLATACWSSLGMRYNTARITGKRIPTYNFLRRVQPGRSGCAPRKQGTGQKKMASSCARGRLGWISGKILSWKGLPSLGTAAQGSVGVSIPGGI